MENHDEILRLKVLKDLLIKKTYKLEKSGIEGREELKRRIVDKLGVSNDEYVVGEDEVINYLNEINRGIDFLDNLPLILKKAIEIYYGENFRDINGFLRKNEGLKRGTNTVCSHIVDWLTLEEACYYVEGVIDALDVLIDQTKLEKGMVLYRGCDLNQFKDLNINDSSELLLAIGDNFVEHGYSSTTEAVGGTFFDDSPIVMVIKVLPGTHIVSFGGSKLAGNTREIVIERDVCYTINDVEIIDGKVFVYTEVESRNLDKEIVNVSDIKMVLKEEDLRLDKNISGYNEDEFLLDDLDFSNISSFGHGGR